VVASRPTIASEVAAAPADVRDYLADQARALLDDPNGEDLLAAHLNNAQDPAATIAMVRTVLRELCSAA
jgi:hypothetical protein